VIEQVLREGRRGARFRPFCRAAGVKNRGYSKLLQRALTDFGAEESFGRAADRVKEHYRISISSTVIRRTTFQHAKGIVSVAEKIQLPPAKSMVTEMDGSLIPVVRPSAGAVDRRRGKSLLWREVRLCCARAVGRVGRTYGATLGSLESTSWMWNQTARKAGLTGETYVHGVGDGAPWILEKFNENFEQQGKYLLDFYHVSEYLAKAARAVVGEKKSRDWLRRQQGRLLNNGWAKVLKGLEKHVEPAATSAESAPVRSAYRYIHERKEHLDFEGARKRAYPIGSGEIESAHRHVIQKRLKLPGSWWKETNAEVLLNLRTARANNCWNTYWYQN
jgi:hypothetical protein